MRGQLSAEAKVFLKAYKGEYAHRGGRHADRLVESMAAFDATDYFEGPLVGLSEWQQDEVAGVSYCYRSWMANPLEAKMLEDAKTELYRRKVTRQEGRRCQP